MFRSIFMGNPDKIKAVYDQTVRTALNSEAGLHTETVFSKAEVLSEPERFRETEYIFATWGMPHFETDEIRAVFPALRAVFYAAGSVQGFAKEFLEAGAAVFSAWAANAVPVAEYTTAQIVLANKGFYASSVLCQKGRDARKEAGELFHHYRGNYGASVGIIGAGMIGRMVLERLKAYRLKVMLCDPFVSEEQAAALGAEKCTLEEMFATCDVISNHVANNPQTVGMLNGALFARMKPYATFINTGRGAQVVESELLAFLASRPDVTAVLDVTDPEPPIEGSPMYTLDNVVLTPHIAGSSGEEVHRMAEYMLAEFRAFAAGEPTKYSVSLKMLATMA